MKKITLLAVSLLMVITAMAADIVGGTKLYLKPNSNWTQANARFAAYFYGAGGDAWADFSLAADETSIYEAITPEGTWTNVIFCRMNPGTTENNWNNKWDQTVDLSYDGTKNLFTIKDGEWNQAQGVWSQYVVGKPVVEMVLPAYSVLNQEIIFSATSENVTNPVYVYSVKQGEDEYTVLQGNTWTPSVEGIYTVKVEVKEGTDGAVVASQELSTTVVFKPEEITIQVQVPTEGLSAWTAEGGVYFYVWGEGMEGTFVQATAESDNWYSYTISTATAFPFNFIVLNGSSWDALKPETGGDSDVRRQSVDMMNITASTCYIMVNGGETEGQNNWKKELNPAECPSEGGEPTAIEEVENAPLFSINGRMLNVALNNEAPIAIFTINGQLIENTVASNYTREMQQGVYVIRIGNTTQKAVIF